MPDPTRPIVRKIAGAAIESPVDGDLTLLNVSTGRFEGLSGVGLAIWRALDETDDPARIKAVLADRYAVDPATCDAEVDAFLDALVEARLLTRT